MIIPSVAADRQAIMVKAWLCDRNPGFLGRPDVRPLGDFDIRVAVRTRFSLRKLPDPVKLTKIAEPRGPYRSTASGSLWRGLDPQDRDPADGK